MDKKDIVKILEEIEKSVKNDVDPIINLYINHFKDTDEGIGLFTIPRIIFPEIDNLGAYYKGTIYNSSQNAISFIKDYFSQIEPEYKEKGAFIYVIYRHGLMHQHTPKLMSYRKKNVGWVVSLSLDGVGHLDIWGKTVQLNAGRLYDNYLGALNLYKNDIQKGDQKLINKFILAHKEMATPMSKTKLLKRDYLQQSDFNFLK